LNHKIQSLECRKLYIKKGKAIPVTGRGGSEGCETSRFPHVLDNLLTDGTVISLTSWLPFTLQVNFWYSFLLEAESIPDYSAAGEIRKIEKNPRTSSGIKPATFQLVA
jgi:hypothetical protein